MKRSRSKRDDREREKEKEGLVDDIMNINIFYKKKQISLITGRRERMVRSGGATSQRTVSTSASSNAAAATASTSANATANNVASLNTSASSTNAREFVAIVHFLFLNVLIIVNFVSWWYNECITID